MASSHPIHQLGSKMIGIKSVLAVTRIKLGSHFASNKLGKLQIVDRTWLTILESLEKQT